MDNKIKNKNNKENKENKREFLKCCVCGNIVEMLFNAGPPISCCDKEMVHITEDAAVKKNMFR